MSRWPYRLCGLPGSAPHPLPLPVGSAVHEVKNHRVHGVLELLHPIVGKPPCSRRTAPSRRRVAVADGDTPPLKILKTPDESLSALRHTVLKVGGHDGANVKLLDQPVREVVRKEAEQLSCLVLHLFCPNNGQKQPSRPNLERFQS